MVEVILENNLIRESSGRFFMVLKAAVFKTALGGCYKPTLTELCHLHPTFSLMIVSLFFKCYQQFQNVRR